MSEYVLVAELVETIRWWVGGENEERGSIRSPEYYGLFSGVSSECLRPVLVRVCGERGMEGREGRELFLDDRIGSNRAVADRLETLPPVCNSDCLGIRSGSGLRATSKFGKPSDDIRRGLGDVV